MTNINFIKTLTAGVALAFAFYPQAFACEEGYVKGAKTGNCIPASGSCGTGCTYTLDAQGALVISGNGEIRHDAFRGNQDIINTTIEKGITTISWDAFNSVSNMESISIPNSVKTMSSQIFMYNSKLKSIEIPDSVTSFSTYYTFYGCNNLEYLSLPENFRGSIPSYAITSNKLTFVVPEGASGNITNTPNIYCTGAQIEKGICGSQAQHYEKVGNNYIVYNKDGTIKDIFQKFSDFNQTANKGFEDKNFVINDDGSIYLMGDDGISIKYDAYGNIKAAYSYNADGSVYTYDQSGKLVGAKKTTPFTPAEAAALVKKGNVNTVTLTFK